MKINVKGVITKSKQEFLDAEREWFPSMSTEEYYKYMSEDLDSCKKCNTIHWKDCIKRCKCE